MVENIFVMVVILFYDLCGLWDWVILLVGYIGGLCCLEIVSFDVYKDDMLDFGGWIEILEKGVLFMFNVKIGWCEVEIGCGFSD